MQGYIARRMALFLPTLLFISLIIFGLMRVVPGDVAVLILAGPEGDNRFSQDEVNAVREQLGLNEPIYVQYGVWIKQMVTLDFGESLYRRSPLAPELFNRFFRVTLELTILTVLVSLSIAIPSGIIQAVKKDTAWDYGLRGLAIAGIAMPSFVVGTLMLLITVRTFGWIPPLEYSPLWEDPWSNLQQMMLPALALGYALSASLTRMTRSTALEVLRQDYVRTAHAKGVAPRRVLVRHVLRNALLPVVTLAGLQIGSLLGGTVIIETLFNLPGVGRAMIQAIVLRDYPMVQFIVMLFGILFLIVNLVVDLTYGFLDPRIRYD